jgi:hypothetical protein
LLHGVDALVHILEKSLYADAADFPIAGGTNREKQGSIPCPARLPMT